MTLALDTQKVHDVLESELGDHVGYVLIVCDDPDEPRPHAAVISNQSRAGVAILTRIAFERAFAGLGTELVDGAVPEVPQ